MPILIETKRLILRELLPTDEAGMFALDADPEVQTFLGNKPITSLEQAQQTIAMVRQQYFANGIGRWAMVDKTTNNFMGWAGLKLITEPINQHVNYYDLGYRLIREYWHLGFATEAARAVLDYGFNIMRLKEIYAMADTRNLASKNVLEKVGFSCLSTFDYEGIPNYWFCITK